MVGNINMIHSFNRVIWLNVFLLTLVWFSGSAQTAEVTNSPVFKNKSTPIAARVADLMSRMTKIIKIVLKTATIIRI